MFGLTERDIKTIHKILGRYPEVVSVVIFGSRAKGNFRKESDIDLAIMNCKIPPLLLAVIQDDFKESDLPYKVDVLDYHSLEHAELKEHIDRVGINIYTRANFYI